MVKTAAEPRTPSIATATAERRWAEVGAGKKASRGRSVDVPLAGMDVADGEDEVKKDVGRAIRTTPSREMRDAYCAERGKGSFRKR
jgi:hypothetical protein